VINHYIHHICIKFIREYLNNIGFVFLHSFLISWSLSHFLALNYWWVMVLLQMACHSFVLLMLIIFMWWRDFVSDLLSSSQQDTDGHTRPALDPGLGHPTWFTRPGSLGLGQPTRVVLWPVFMGARPVYACALYVI